MVLGAALLGCGNIGRVHARSLTSGVGPVRLRAVYDFVESAATAVRDEACRERGAEPSDIRIVSGDGAWRPLLASPDIHVVVICSPTQFHAEQAIAAAEAGKHIYCEKPVALTAAEAEAVQDAVAAAGVLYMTGFQRRFDEGFEALARRVAGGELGQVLEVCSISRDMQPPPLAYLQGSNTIFHDCLSHDFDMVRFVTGEEIVGVAASGLAHSAACQSAGDYDLVLVAVRLSGGGLGSIRVSRSCPFGYDQRFEVMGTAAAAFRDNEAAHSTVHGGGDGLRAHPPHSHYSSRYAAAYRRALAAFVRAARARVEGDSAGESSPCPLDNGRIAIVLADACLASVEAGGGWVDVDAAKGSFKLHQP